MTENTDFEHDPDPSCQKCGGTGWVTLTDWVDYGSTVVPMNSDEPCECTYCTRLYVAEIHSTTWTGAVKTTLMLIEATTDEEAQEQGAGWARCYNSLPLYPNQLTVRLADADEIKMHQSAKRTP